MKDMGSPLVSIGIGVYNPGQILKQTLACLRDQTYPHLELILIDDGSTDGSWEYIQEEAKRDPRLQVYQNKRRVGQYHNFNQVFLRSKGDYFVWSGDHDIWEPHAIDEMVTALSTHSRWVYASPVSLPEPWSASDFQSEKGVDRVSAVLKSGHPRSLYGMFRTEALSQTRLNLPFSFHEFVLFFELAFRGGFWFNEGTPLFKPTLNYTAGSKLTLDYQKKLKRRQSSWVGYLADVDVVLDIEFLIACREYCFYIDQAKIHPQEKDHLLQIIHHLTADSIRPEYFRFFDQVIRFVRPIKSPSLTQRLKINTYRQYLGLVQIFHPTLLLLEFLIAVCDNFLSSQPRPYDAWVRHYERFVNTTPLQTQLVQLAQLFAKESSVQGSNEFKTWIKELGFSPTSNIT